MKAQIGLAALLVFLSDHFEETVGGIFNFFSFVVQNWLIFCLILWVATSGVYLLMHPNMNPIDAFGITLYMGYMFFFVPIPIPVVLFGSFAIGTDPLTGLILFSFNAGKLMAGFIFSLMIGYSLFHYTWMLAKLMLDMIGAFD
jgi:hypothetical protein